MNEGKVRRNDAVEDAVCSSEEFANLGNFAIIAKISLGLRKFRNHSNNFAILAKLRNFARLAKFRYIVKITVPSEITHFRYL